MPRAKLGYFVDHTGLHGLAKRTIRPRDLAVAALELLQFAETVLLADAIWLSDAETQDTLDRTNSILLEFREAGLQACSNRGLLKWAHFDARTLRRVGAESTQGILQILTSIEDPAFARPLVAPHRVRPDGVEPLRFENVAAIEYGSDEAEEFPEAAFHSHGWSSTGGVALLNPRLHEWLERHLCGPALRRPSIDQEVLNVIFRWQINRRLAARVFETGGECLTAAGYAPALGRARAIGRLEKVRFPRLRSSLAQHLVSILERRLPPSDVGLLASHMSCPSHALPLLALDTLLRQPANVSRKQFVEALARARAGEELATLREWLSAPQTDEYDIETVCARLSRELAQRHGRKPLLRLTVGSISDSGGFGLKPDGRIVQDILNASARTGLRRLGRDFYAAIFGRKEATVLNQLISESLGDIAVDEVLGRVASILNPSRE